MTSVDGINKKLQQDEEWLRTFEQHVTRSGQLKTNIEGILNNFESHLDSLERNVLPMHETNGKLQIKQQNIQRLLKSIDTTIIFFGRKGVLETAIRDGSPGHDLDAYLEQMESLQQAISFFQTYPNYTSQLENMNATLESGFFLLEKEFKNIVNTNSSPADASALVDSLDEQYELIPGRAKELQIVRAPEKMARLSDWLLKRGRPRRFLQEYSKIRGEHMRRALLAVVQLHASHLTAAKHMSGGASGTSPGPTVSSSVTPTNRVPRSTSFAKTPTKAKRFGIERGPGVREGEGGETECALLLLGCFVALVQLEEAVLDKSIKDVSARAQVHCDLFKQPLDLVLKRVSDSVQECQSGLPALLPLLRFASVHYVQLDTIARNGALGDSFPAFFRALQMKCHSLCKDFIDRLDSGEAARFVPSDGNVHPQTANALKMLCLLAHYRQTLTNHVLVLSAHPSEPASLLMPKHFAKLLSALGGMLKRKAGEYDDGTLAAIFSLNNNNYIAKALDEEESGLLPVLREQNAHILQYYLSAIQKNITDYMASWMPVLSTLAAVDQIHSDDRNGLKNMVSAFNREFEQTIASQREYCVADPALAEDVRGKVKAAVLAMYGRLYVKASGLTGENSLSKHIRYSEESLEANIDRLFDVSV